MWHPSDVGSALTFDKRYMEVVTMTVKEYLNRARFLDQEINAKIDHLEKIDSMVNRVTASISDMPGRDKPDNNKRERLIVKMIDLRWEINEEIDRLVDTKREINGFIGKIAKEKHRLLLELRYINLCTWEEIAIRMNVTERSVYRLHGAALLAAAEIYDK